MPRVERRAPSRTPRISRFTLIPLLILGACAGDAGAGPGSWYGSSAVPLRVYHDPYGQVDWDTDARLLAQMHDHLGNGGAQIDAYDRAGYQVLSLMDYSGVASLPYSWTQRHWPAVDWVPHSVYANLKHIRFFVSNAEEIGAQHMTSPFLTTYIAVAADSGNAPGTPEYTTIQEAIELNHQHGGLAVVAHPWYDPDRYLALAGVDGVEIYSAYVVAK